ncbi:hypothetical protein I6F16_34125 [Bradyrhizobium sp. IC4060]|nr:hypothetical protein [Bradyrhizobium sp. IC4060]MCA1488445.1 hypothetical protein [Bradyrhizobium sp. IC4061]
MFRSAEAAVQQLARSFQFVLQAKALTDNPYDAHTLCHVIDDAEAQTGPEIERTYVDKGYRDHDAQNSRSAFIFGHERSVIRVFARELRRRHAIEFSSVKAGGHLGRCYLKDGWRCREHHPRGNLLGFPFGAAIK